MPGAINNEDYSIIDVKNGVYVTHPLGIPDGYASSLKNFTIKDGIITQRMPVYIAATNSPNTHPNAFIGDSITGIPIQEIGLPAAGGRVLMAATVSVIPAAPRSYLLGFISGPGARVGKVLPAATLSGALCVYNGNLYAGTSTGVIKIGVANFPTSITETAVPSSPTGLIKMITHKSRLFGITGITNRLYFTDAPAVGTLPENWNTTVNFIDFNGPNGQTNINDIVSLNNYIYVFTNNGLFSLYTTGAASNWIVKLVNPDVAVHGINQVVTKNNLIYFVAEDGVYVTDGFDFKLISQALSEKFTGIYQQAPQLMWLTPFDNGILLRTKGDQTTTEGEFFYTRLESIAWTNIDFCDVNNLDGGPRGVLAVLSADMYDPSFGTVTFLLIQHSDIPNTVNNSLAYEYKTPANSIVYINKDLLPIFSGNETISSTLTRDIKLDIITKEIVGSNFTRLKLFRDLIVLFGSEVPFNVDELRAWYNGSDYNTIIELPSQVTSIAQMANTIPHSPNMQTMIKCGLGQQSAYSIRLAMNLTLQQISNVQPIKDRFFFTLQAIGYSAQLERTVPGSSQAGVM